MILVAPFPTWSRVVDSRWRWSSVLLISILPLMILSGVVEGVARMELGDHQTAVSRVAEVSETEAIRFELVQFAMDLVLLFFGAMFIRWICRGFDIAANYGQCFTLTAYGFTPILWVRMVDAVPDIPTWACWGGGAVGILYVLYHGVALVFEPDASTGFGLYMICSFAIVFLTGLAHFVALATIN